MKDYCTRDCEHWGKSNGLCPEPCPKKYKIFCFHEYNSWEGEHWCFYIAMTEKKMLHLRELIKNVSYYQLSDSVYTIEKVRTLEESNSGDGYMGGRHFYLGKLENLPLVIDFDNEDPFYKGGIENFCKLT